jgi:serine/threonine protein kinase
MATVPFVSQANIPVSFSPQPPKVTLAMNPLHENGGPHSAAPLPEPSLPAPQRDWRNMTRTIAHYERIEQIGEGTYGQVYRARCKDTNQIVALKKIRVHHGGYWGMPPTVIREIKILKRLRHPSLVQMVEVVSSKGVEHLDEEDEVEEKHKLSKKDRIIDAREGYKGNLFLVLEYVAHDLTGLMDVAYRFSEVQVKCVFKQLLEALQYMHDNKYVHRDIKSSNILIDHNFRVKLADFGLARCIEPPILDRIHEYVNFCPSYRLLVTIVLSSCLTLRLFRSTARSVGAIHRSSPTR